MAELNLGKQIGPLPLGGWIVVVAGGLTIGYFINRNMAKGAAKEPDSTQLTESGTGGGGQQFIYDPPQSGTPSTPEDTNNSWGVKVTNWLVSQNHSPSVADQAVRKYLSGLVLTVAEKALINLAIIQFGVPPEPLPPVDEPTTPPASTLLKPDDVQNAYINAATRRNAIVWWHSGKNVTHFFVQARFRATGNTETAKVGAYTVPGIPPVGTWYTWNHYLWHGAAQNYTVDYLIVPWNENVMGNAARLASNFRM